MRLICTLDDQSQAYRLSAFLIQKGINNQLELTTNTDWGSHEYGNITCRIWVYEEDQMKTALEIASEFLQNPSDPRFQVKEKPTAPLFEVPISDENQSEPPLIKIGHPRPAVKEKQPLGIITFYLVLICSILLVFGSTTTPAVKTIPPNIPYLPLLYPPINKALIYDYPKAYELIDKLINLFGIPSLENPEELPPEGKAILIQYNQTPYWHGIYDKVIEHFKNPSIPWNFDAPMFEKLRQGEVWRLFTPSLLHQDIFHLFFNMIWLIVLGKQMEQRMGKSRYILFILITGIVSNTAQYLMSGPNFLGFSGVLCGMLTFIWMKQKIAAWEGYQLEKSTMAFISFFILFMVALQAISFFLEFYGKNSLPIGIANTAHLIGALMGVILARFRIFSWQH